MKNRDYVNDFLYQHMKTIKNKSYIHSIMAAIYSTFFLKENCISQEYEVRLRYWIVI